MRNRLLILYLGFFLLSRQMVHAQGTVENLVFEGSGIRGIAFSGAIQELEDKGLLKGVKRVGGTSAGAITALMISLGYRADEIREIIGRTNFKKFNDGRFFFPGGINRLNRHFGWYQGRRVQHWLENIILAKTGNGDITFADLKNRGFKELYVTGTSLNEQKLVVFSAEKFPGMKVKDAVRISMSIPLYFEPLYMDTQGHIISRPRNRENLRVMVDGGFIANFPIRLFDSTRFEGNAPNEFFHNPKTIGFRIDREEQVQNDKEAKGLVTMPVNNLGQYIAAFYSLVIENLNRQDLTAEDWERTVSISDGNIGPRIRKLKPGEIEVLYNNGKLATKEYLLKQIRF